MANSNSYLSRNRAAIASFLIATLILTSAVVPALADNPGIGQTSSGQELIIQIDPAIQNTLLLPGEPINIVGATRIGALATQANVLYVVDVSGSTSGPRSQDCNDDGVVDAGDDLNGDGSRGDTLDCEISGVIAINNSLSALPNVSAGLVLFGSSAAIADVRLGGGEEAFTAPLNVDNDGNTFVDINEVAVSLTEGRASLYSNRRVGSGTNFDAAIASINAAFDSTSGGSNIAFFLSDGGDDVQTGFNSPLETAKNGGTNIFTYSVGSSAAGCGIGSDLRIIADETGGTCFEVSDPTQLTAVLPGTTPTGIERVELRANGNGPYSVTLDALGNWSGTIPGGVVQFPLTVEATVFATDGTQVTADLVLAPPQPTSLEIAEEPQNRQDASAKWFLPIIQ